MRFLLSFLFFFSLISLSAQDECAFDFHLFDANFKDQALANFVTKGVRPPFKHLEIPFADFTIEPNRPKIFTLPSGTMIDVPKNAFTDANGKIVDEKVVLYYREFNTPTDILLSGIPMNFKTAEGDMPMQSAGMFEIRASTTEGEAVFPNPEQPINVSVISEEVEDNFNYYEMDDASGTWEDRGESKLDFDFVFKPVDFSYPPILKYPDLYIRFQRGIYRLRGHDKLQFKTGIRYPSRKERKNRLSLFLTEMNAFKNITWIYDGADKDRKSIKEKLYQISIARNEVYPKLVNNSWQIREEVDSLQIRDIRLSINPVADNYLLSFVLEEETFSVPVYPYLKTSNNKVEQQRNLKSFQKYLSMLEEREIVWERNKAFYEAEKIEFDKNQSILEANANRAIDSKIKDIQNTNAFARRKVEIQSFGLCNIDRINLNLDKEEILVKLSDEKGNPLKAKAIYFWDKTNQVLLSYFSNRVRLMRNSKDYMVTVLLSNDQTVVLESEDFKPILESVKNRKLNLTVNPFSNETLERQQLTEKITAL